jgi:enoyl-CoA hydratase
MMTLNAPEQRNAISTEMAAAIEELCLSIENDTTIGAVIVRGAGGYFCSGGNRAELAAISARPTATESVRMLTKIYGAFWYIGHLPVPTIAAIRGGAVGAGLNLALATDVRIVAEDAVIGSGFAALGLHPGGGHLSLLNRLAGPEVAVALGVLGQTVDGRRAVDLGLAWQCVPAEEVDQAAIALAQRAGSDPELARVAIRSARMQSGPPALPWAASIELERAAQMWSFDRKGSDGWRGGERPLRAPRG